MSVQAISQSISGPAAKSIVTGFGQANGSTKRATEADEKSKVVQPLLKYQRESEKVQSPVRTNLQFTVDMENRRVFIKISDVRTGKVIIEAPPEKIAKAMDQLLENQNGSGIDLEA